MTRILLAETASPRRVRAKAEKILEGGIFPDPRLTILCGPDTETVAHLREIDGVELVPLEGAGGGRVPSALRRRDFDVLVTFWTGEKKYRWRKLAVLGLAKTTYVDSGDGGQFRLTWKAIIRHSLFRLQHPLPTDHAVFVPRPEARNKLDIYDGERVLIVQSAEPHFVLRALERLERAPLFRNPRYTLFCRNRPEVTSRLQGHPLLFATQTHSEATGAWKHWRALRRVRFDAVVVFFTGDPSYWKIKYFAFLLGARHKVIFNENNDCFYFSWRHWLSLVSLRARERACMKGDGRRTYQLREAALLGTKLLLLPARFAWLLLVRVGLRGHAACSRQESTELLRK